MVVSRHWDARDRHTVSIGVVTLILASLTVVLPLANRAQAQTEGDAQRVESAGINYLMTNFNTSVGLIRNSPDSLLLRNEYYLYSDNYLSVLALSNLANGNSTLVMRAEKIGNTMSGYLSKLPYTDVANQYTAMGSGACSFNGSRDFLLFSTGEEKILATVNNQTGSLPASGYADIALLQAVCYYNQYESSGNESGLAAAKTAYFSGNATFDGTGFRDKPYTDPNSSSYHEYQTYKLALYIYASKLLNYSFPQSALSRLVSMSATNQTEVGGFYTCYNANSVPECGTNAETTAVAILAIHGPPISPPTFPVPDFPVGELPVVYFVVVAIALFQLERLGRGRFHVRWH